ncbi:VOC family protein [Blastococcus sp. SYSU DS0973]
MQRYNEPGSLVRNEAAADDQEAARAFYSAVFGFRFEEIPGGEGYTTFSTGQNPLGGLGGAVPGGPKGWSTCFAVASTDGAVATVTSAGGKALLPAEDTEFGRFAVVADP